MGGFKFTLDLACFLKNSNALREKNVRIRNFHVRPCFPAFGLNRDQENSKYGQFSRTFLINRYSLECGSFTKPMKKNVRKRNFRGIKL